MARCQDNRKRRKKRDKKFLLRLAHKRIDRAAWKAAGVSPNYYDVLITVATKHVKGCRVFDQNKTRFSVRPNAKYLALIEQLAAMFKGVTVTIPAPDPVAE